MEAELEIFFLLSKDGAGKSQDELSAVFPQFSAERMQEALGTLKRTRVISRDKNRYKLVHKSDLVVGRMDAKEKGFGFLMGPQCDHYIAPRKMNGAMKGDVVLAKRLSRRGKGGCPEAEVKEVLRRKMQRVIGRYEFHDSYAVVAPADKRLFYNVLIPKGKRSGAQEGQIVVAEIERYPDSSDAFLVGRITEIVGNEWDPRIQIEMTIREHELRTEFPENVLAEAEAKASQPLDFSKRRDFRDQLVVTIDGLDAKDFDDAVAVTKTEDGYYLTVHIADVAHYVSWGGAVWGEAEARATSVYLVDRVLPMLPPVLSNDICSLRPNEDRLTMSVEMWLDNQGKLLKHAVHQGVIHSDARLTYEEVDRFFEGGEHQISPEVGEMLNHLKAFSKLMEAKRVERGSLDFEGVEPKVILDDEGKPLDIILRKRTDATQLIEETMILTNETVAAFMRDKSAGMIYRIHDEPDADLMAQLEELLGVMGFTENWPELSARYLQRILEFSKGKEEALLINTMLLRSMKQARYTQSLRPHFGLASPCYTHFTSPIRRLPDLVVHHLLKAVLHVTGRADDMLLRLPHLAEHASLMEREAENAERESVEVKVCELMEGRVGEIFPAIISGVTNFGLFVELANTAEGLIHVNDLPTEGWNFDQQHYQLVSRRSGRTYRLGGKVDVVLKKVKIAERQLDFMLADQ